MPRETLKQALIAETKLTNTQDLSGTKKEFFVDVECRSADEAAPNVVGTRCYLQQ